MSDDTLLADRSGYGGKAMTDLREEVAHAIWEALNGPWEFLSREGQEACFAEADAAIAVMRLREDDAYRRGAEAMRKWISDRYENVAADQDRFGFMDWAERNRKQAAWVRDIRIHAIFPIPEDDHA